MAEQAHATEAPPRPSCCHGLQSPDPESKGGCGIFGCTSAWLCGKMSPCHHFSHQDREKVRKLAKAVDIPGETEKMGSRDFF